MNYGVIRSTFWMRWDLRRILVEARVKDQMLIQPMIDWFDRAYRFGIP